MDKPFDEAEDDIESLNIDIDKILGDNSINTIEYGASNEPEPASRYRMTAPSPVMDYRPDDLIIENPCQDDDVSATLTEEIVFCQNTQSYAKDVHDDDRQTDGTVQSSEEEDGSEAAFNETHYKYACVLGVLLFLIICGLGYIFGTLVQNRTSSRANSSTQFWTLRPTLSPTVVPITSEPSTAPSISPTRLPTPTTQPPTESPSNRPTMNPSASPTVSASTHLLELLTSTASGQTIEAIGVRGTDQQKAYEWVNRDPNYFDYSTISKIQRFALAVLYFSVVEQSAIASEALETWMDYDTHECLWYFSWYENRLPCGGDGIFKFLTLRNINLVGKLPAELSLLNRLVSLVITDNALTGSIPQEFGEWASLENLDLHGNFLRGRIPNLRNVPKLQEINLSLNFLTGYVPAGVGNLNITSLDLRNNPNLGGVVPFRLCSLSYQIQVLAADCNQIYCSCCTICDSNATRAPFMAPSTTLPRTTPGPTTSPTSPPSLRLIVPPAAITGPSPTKRPTPAPTTRPTPPPTTRPTPAPTTRPIPLPTPQPTFDRNCIDNVRTSKQCYKVGEPIDVIYSNCSPTFADWIGIYGTNTPENSLFDPLLSHPTCINEPCSGVQQISTIYLDGGVRGSSNWPLSGGSYTIFMFHGGSFGGPYTFFSKTLSITVSENSC